MHPGVNGAFGGLDGGNAMLGCIICASIILSSAAASMLVPGLLSPSRGDASSALIFKDKGLPLEEIIRDADVFPLTFPML